MNKKTKQDKAAEFKEQITEVLKPLAAAVDGQAPVIPFAPYANDEYSEPFAPILLEKVNALAGKIWTGREGYEAQRFVFLVGSTEEEKAVVEKNQKYFDHGEVYTALRSLFNIRLNLSDAPGFYDHIRMNELLKKLKRLEKRYDREDIISDDMHEQIINKILTPSHMYGIRDNFSFVEAAFRHPPQKAVVNELLTTEDMLSIENLINYIPRIRSLLKSFRAPSGEAVKSKRLLAKWMLEPNSYHSSKDDQRFLSNLTNMANFFNCCLPYAVRSDLIPVLKYPMASNLNYEKLGKASAALRDATLGFIKEEKQLSDLLQAIGDLSQELQTYFNSMATEVEACFQFLNRISVPFDKLVEESKIRIDNSGNPF